MTGTKHHPSSLDLYKLNVLRSELWRLENLNIKKENIEIYTWLQSRIRSLEEGK